PLKGPPGASCTLPLAFKASGPSLSPVWFPMAFLRKRSRFRETARTSGRYRTSGVTPWTDFTTAAGLLEEITDESPHWGYYAGTPQSTGDVGGPLTIKRSGVVSATTRKHTSALFEGTVQPGFITGYGVGALLGSPVLATGTNMNAFGASAIANALPTNPNFSLATALGELRSDGIPDLPGASLKERVSVARGAGHEYLNVEFGWLPLIRDVRAFAHSVKNSHELIAQYVKNSDRKIRRRTGGPSASSSASMTGSGALSPSAGNFSCTCYVRETAETKYWFSGAFRYHVPLGDSTWDRLSRYEQYSNYLLGTRMTPEVLWNIAPWSWAVDWFTNTGDVIHNISTLGFDGLVMQYGYAMRQSTLLSDQRFVTTGSASRIPFGWEFQRQEVLEYKQRIAANPYGFGVTDLSLSSRQLGILAALGLTQGARRRGT
ncbi:maturation protein, partial [ssRNA phage Gephyllon.1_23]